MVSEYADQASTGTMDFQDYDVNVLPLREILAAHAPGDIHFLKVDVEGYEYEALEGNDWVRHRPQVVCVSTRP